MSPQNDTKPNNQNWRADLMLVGCYLSIAVIVVALTVGKIDPGGALAGFLFTLGGGFAKNISTAFDFEFGSSRSSKDKDATIATAANTANTTANTAMVEAAADLKKAAVVE